MKSEAEVLEMAGNAYYIAKLRNQRRDLLDKDLSKEFPDHYRRFSVSGHYVFEGHTAEKIIDDWLGERGHRRGSDRWAKMVRLAVERGEELYKGRMK